MHQHLRAVSLVSEIRNRDLNEADTRHQVIDTILHEVLDWPKSAVRVEKDVHPGFADYVLSKASGQIGLIIEAKRSDHYFSLPASVKGKSMGTFVSVNTLCTDKSIAAAIGQVREYCLNFGCSFGAVTNGHEWVFFRVFENGVDWRSLRAYVIPSLEAFSDSFTNVYNALSYRRVSYDGSLNEILSRNPHDRRETFRPGHEIPAYARAIQPNRYVQYLRPIAEKYFGVIDENEVEFMDAVYVSDKEYDQAFRSAQSMLSDALTPYLEDHNVRQIKNDDGGGAFGNRLKKSITEKSRRDVVVLFGGKGIGKSTFLRKLLYVRPPQILKKNAATVIVDLLNTPEDKSKVSDVIWLELVSRLDVDGLLSGDREQLLALFCDRVSVAEKQDLCGIPKDSVDYQKTINGLVAEWKKDNKYVATRLVERLRRQHKGAIVVIDNTDQYSRKLQEFCFMSAHEIAELLDCLVIISMREERFYASSIHGVLDAYQNSGFHLSAPQPKSVFIKRLEFVANLLSTGPKARLATNSEDANVEIRKTLRSLLKNFEQEFRNIDSHLAGFLTACAHGNIRLALELFRGMLISRYTNIEEITSVKYWTWQIHQVLKPVMIPNRFFYDESQSHVPNIFQLRSKVKASHFSALRILQPLARLNDLQGAAFLPVSSLLTDFSSRFQMDDDFQQNTDMLLKYGLIEANNRIDEYSNDIDGLRITTYGRYLFDDLLSAFTYIELVSTDTAVFDSRVSAELAKLSTEEYRLWEASWSDAKKRVERVETRIKKANEFIDYLVAEEDREAELFGLTVDERFTTRIKLSLEDEISGVLRSANRQKFK